MSFIFPSKIFHICGVAFIEYKGVSLALIYGADMFTRIKPSLGILTKSMLCIAILCFSLTACDQETPANSGIKAGVAKLKEDSLAARKAEAVMAAMSLDELRKLASNSFLEQRLYAPAGDNAVEYYLAIRKKSAQPDPLTESALVDLTPYTVIAAEQAIGRNDFEEASRLRNLIAAVDAYAPALPRIGEAITDGLKNTEEAMAAAETKREQDTLLAVKVETPETLPQQLKTPAREPPLKTAIPAIQTAESSAPVSAESMQNIPPVVTTNSPTPRPIVTAPAVNQAKLVAIRTPDPLFPGDLLNRGLSGAVEIEFIVQRSGEVSEVRVVNSSQRAFDRNIMQTVKRWKFGPLDEPVTIRRSFNFSNPS
jgi:periplasmic protein TonB